MRAGGTEHRPEEGPSEAVGSRENSVQHRVPAALVHQKKVAVAQHGGVVDKSVDAAVRQLVCDLSHQVGIRDVATVADRTSSVPGHRLNHFTGGVLTATVQKVDLVPVPS